MRKGRRKGKMRKRRIRKEETTAKTERYGREGNGR